MRFEINFRNKYLVVLVLISVGCLGLVVAYDPLAPSHPASQIVLEGGGDLQSIINEGGIGGVWGELGDDIYYLDGKVGIGTASPKEKLHVAGDYYGKGSLWLYAYGGDGNSGVAYIQARDDSGSSNIELQFRTQNVGGIESAVRIDNYGNVGIGTTDPQSRLHVKGNAGALNLEGVPGDLGGHVFMGFYPEGYTQGRRAYIGFSSNGAIDLTIANSNAGGAINLNAPEGVCLNGVCINEWPEGGGEGDITSVGAGAGLTGGGIAGAVSLNVGDGEGILVGADSISFDCSEIDDAGSIRCAGEDIEVYSLSASDGYPDHVVFVDSVGNVQISGALGVAGSITVDGNWVRVKGDNGIIFQDHGGGWRMDDDTWIKSYGNKPVYINEHLRVGGIHVGGLTDPGTNNLIVDGMIRQGSGSVAGYEIQTEGDLYVGGIVTASTIDVETSITDDFIVNSGGSTSFAQIVSEEASVGWGTYSNSDTSDYVGAGFCALDKVYRAGDGDCECIINYDGNRGWHLVARRFHDYTSPPDECAISCRMRCI
ncbi:MAG: hypothetical protein KJ718_04590 [Nanoarchaeota archaeon]|nr:hypothetical protein [Nanoarchaeota archaeon]MBU1051804.1 hypothetical protein [Nanoarchaeota archaeon]MBU1988563.1 hypothetical protein [Nanoarchaeota archaeon]